VPAPNRPTPPGHASSTRHIHRTPGSLRGTERRSVDPTIRSMNSAISVREDPQIAGGGYRNVRARMRRQHGRPTFSGPQWRGLGK
jgi:hypothetical protein